MKMNYKKPETEVILINPEDMMQVDVGSGKVGPGAAEGKQDGIIFEEDVAEVGRTNVWDD